MSERERLYRFLEERDPMQLDEDGNYYIRHVEAMTGEGLYAKSDIAAELGWRDREIDRAEQREAELVAALEFAERRSRQPGEGQNEWFERLADEFYRRYGFLPPGKSEPMEMAISISGDERRGKWEAFLNEPTDARRKALATHESQNARSGAQGN